MGFRGSVILLLAAFLALVPAGPAHADSWVAPQRTTYHSPNRTVRLVVTPHIPADPNLRPFVTEPRGPSAPDRAHAVLQRRDEGGRWVVQWRGTLVNEVMPVGAVVADSGRYFATFDDWGDTGNGPNVVVVYDGAGRTIRALSLLDLVPRDYIETLTHTSFSIWWAGGGHRISEDGERLILDIAIPSLELSLPPSDSVELEVVLATGAPAARTGAEWDRALAASAAWRVVQGERRAAYHALMTEPILPPRSADTEEWEIYLTEVHRRLHDEPGVPMVILFREPPAESYVRWGGTPRDQLLSRNQSMYTAMASPDGSPLAPALEAIVSGRRPGWLRGVQLLIVADAGAWPELLRVMGPSGANLVRIDPATPIPQRPERLREYLEMQAVMTRAESGS